MFRSSTVCTCADCTSPTPAWARPSTFAHSPRGRPRLGTSSAEPECRRHRSVSTDQWSKIILSPILLCSPQSSLRTAMKDKGSDCIPSRWTHEESLRNTDHPTFGHFGCQCNADSDDSAPECRKIRNTEKKQKFNGIPSIQCFSARNEKKASDSIIFRAQNYKIICSYRSNLTWLHCE